VKFDRGFFGPQGFTSEDSGTAGAVYSVVREAILRNPYWLAADSPQSIPLPVYEVNWWRVVRGLRPFGSRWLFRDAAERAVDSRADLRWGPDGRGYRKLLHPNGVCLFGRWLMTEPNPWSGMFECGREALIIARYSTCCTETRRGFTRSLSLVGKLFPTTDPTHTEPLPTANFITQDDLGGSGSRFINDVICRNAPDVTPWRRGWGAPVLLLSGVLFKLLDREPAIRQLYPIAELGKPAGTPTRAPQFLRLVVDRNQPRVGEPGEPLDFRQEILQQVDASRQRTLVFHVEATDEGRVRGLLVKRGDFPRNAWKQIGRIVFDEAVCSYNGDFVVHFPHPPWRTDRNDPATQLRPRRGPHGL
jgi:hypothetical protein